MTPASSSAKGTKNLAKSVIKRKNKKTKALKNKSDSTKGKVVPNNTAQKNKTVVEPDPAALQADDIVSGKPYYYLRDLRPYKSPFKQDLSILMNKATQKYFNTQCKWVDQAKYAVWCTFLQEIVTNMKRRKILSAKIKNINLNDSDLNDSEFTLQVTPKQVAEFNLYPGTFCQLFEPENPTKTHSFVQICEFDENTSQITLTSTGDYYVNYIQALKVNSKLRFRPIGSHIISTREHEALHELSFMYPENLDMPLKDHLIRKIIPSKDSASQKATLMKELLKSHSRKNCFFSRANDSQITTIQNALSSPNFSVFVHGPPATGKTQSMSYSILLTKLINPASKILVVTQANNAVLEAALRVKNLVRDSEVSKKIIRDSEVSKKIIRDSKVSKKVKTTPKMDFSVILSVSGQTIMREHGSSFSSLSSHVVDISNDPVKDIVFCTAISAARLTKIHFRPDFIFIDEASRLNQVEALVPLMSFNSYIKKCFMFGDPNQIGPIVTLHGPIYEPLRKSIPQLFPTELVKESLQIKIQYRMTPRLSSALSETFYNGSLSNGTNVPSLKSGPFHFFHSGGQESKTHSAWNHSVSFVNKIECNLVLGRVKKLLKTPGISPSDIAIITPYCGQLELLQSKMILYKMSKKIRISTLAKFQGNEAKIILLSTVRTKKLGLLSRPEYQCVALSRAKSCLYVFGDKKLLIANPTFKQYLSSVTNSVTP